MNAWFNYSINYFVTAVLYGLGIIILTILPIFINKSENNS